MVSGVTGRCQVSSRLSLTLSLSLCCSALQNKQWLVVKVEWHNVPNDRAERVNHPHPCAVCCDTNSSGKLRQREDDTYKGSGYALSIQGAILLGAEWKCWDNLTQKQGKQIGDNDVSLWFIHSHIQLDTNKSVDDYIHYNKGRFDPRSLYFWRIVGFRTAPGTWMKQKRSCWS